MISDILNEEVNERYVSQQHIQYLNTTYRTQQIEISWNLPATQRQYNDYSKVHILCLQKKENCTYQMNSYRYLLH